MKKRALFIIALLCLSGTRQGDAVLRHPANIVGATDDRAPVITSGLKIGLAQEEIDQIRRAVGYVSCPGTKNKNSAVVTGFLVAPDVVVTVAHIFYDDKSLRRDPLDQCFFQTMGPVSARYSIDLSSIRVGTERPADDRTRDYAVFRLTKPTEGTKPFTVLVPAPVLGPDDVIFPITAYREKRYQKGESLLEPLVEYCSVRKVIPPTNGLEGYIFSDCDNTPGGSGGPNLVRIANRLVVAGIFVGGGFARQDFKPYNDQYSPDEKTSTYSLAFSAPMASHLLNLVRLELVKKQPKAPESRPSVQGTVDFF